MLHWQQRWHPQLTDTFNGKERMVWAGTTRLRHKRSTGRHNADLTYTGFIATTVPRVPQDQATAEPARKNRQKTARHAPELIENVTGDGLFQNPLFGSAEEYGFQNKENGHGSDTVAANFGHGCGLFQNGGFRDSLSVGLLTLKQAA